MFDKSSGLSAGLRDPKKDGNAGLQGIQGRQAELGEIASSL